MAIVSKLLCCTALLLSIAVEVSFSQGSCRTSYYFDGQICRPCTPCPRGEEPLHVCSGTSDTKCRRCPEGSFSHVESLTARCHSCTSKQCDPPELLRQCTAYSDSVCDICGEERYYWADAGVCLYCQKCQEGEAVVQACTYKTNRLCRALPTTMSPTTRLHRTTVVSSIAGSSNSEVADWLIPLVSVLLIVVTLVTAIAALLFCRREGHCYYDVWPFRRKLLTLESPFGDVPKDERREIAKMLAERDEGSTFSSIRKDYRGVAREMNLGTHKYIQPFLLIGETTKAQDLEASKVLLRVICKNKTTVNNVCNAFRHCELWHLATRLHKLATTHTDTYEESIPVETCMEEGQATHPAGTISEERHQQYRSTESNQLHITTSLTQQPQDTFSDGHFATSDLRMASPPDPQPENVLRADSSVKDGTTVHMPPKEVSLKGDRVDVGGEYDAKPKDTAVGNAPFINLHVYGEQHADMPRRAAAASGGDYYDYHQQISFLESSRAMQESPQHSCDVAKQENSEAGNDSDGTPL